MTRLYRMRFEIMETNPGTYRELSIYMEAFSFGAAVESAKLYAEKHLSFYAVRSILGVDEIGKITKPDAP